MHISKIPTPNVPAATSLVQEAFNAYSSDLLRLPGVSRVITNRDALTVFVTDPELLQLDDSVLRDTVDGVKITLGIEPSPSAHAGAQLASVAGGPKPEKIPWFERSSNMLRAVAGMNGVWSWDYNERGKGATFFTVSPAATARLKGLFNTQFGETPVAFVHVTPH